MTALQYDGYSKIPAQTSTISNGDTVGELIGDSENGTAGATLATVIVPDSFGQTSLKFQVSDSATGTFTVLKDENGVDIELTVNGTTGAPYSLGNLIKHFIPEQFIKPVTGGAVTGDQDLKFKLADI